MWSHKTGSRREQVVAPPVLTVHILRLLEIGCNHFKSFEGWLYIREVICKDALGNIKIIHSDQTTSRCDC